MVSSIERFHCIQDSQLGPNGVLYREVPLYVVGTVNSVLIKAVREVSFIQSALIKEVPLYTPIHTPPLYPHTYTSPIPPYIHLPYLLSAEVDGGWQYQIAVVADPDTNSKVGDKDLWRSYLLKGRVNVVATGSGGYSVSVTWDKDLVSESV